MSFHLKPKASLLSFNSLTSEFPYYLEASASVRTTVSFAPRVLVVLKVEFVAHHYHLRHFLGCASELVSSWVLCEFLEVACIIIANSVCKIWKDD